MIFEEEKRTRNKLKYKTLELIVSTQEISKKQNIGDPFRSFKIL